MKSTSIFRSTLLILLISVSARAQVRQQKLYIDDGSGNFTILSAHPGGGNITFPASGTLLTATGGNSFAISGGNALTLTTTNTTNVTFPPGTVTLMANPMTLAGDIMYGGTAGAATVLPGSTTPSLKKFLTSTATSGGVAQAPAWATISASDLPVFVEGTGHAAGAVPDPGSTTGTTKFLREDGNWASPGGGNQVFNGGTGSTGSGGMISTGNSPEYWAPVGISPDAPSAATATVGNGNVMVMTRSGTLKNFYVTVSAKTGSSSNYWTFTLADITANTTGPTVNAGGLSVSGNDVSTTTFTVAAGDLISVLQSYHGTPTNSPSAVWSFEMQ